MTQFCPLLIQACKISAKPRPPGVSTPGDREFVEYDVFFNDFNNRGIISALL